MPDRSERFVTINEEPSRTKQEFKKECDINHIISKYDSMGVLTHLNQAEATYADVTEVTDFSQAMQIIRQAEMDFMNFPAHVRAAFNNDVANFLDAAHDPEKKDELAKLGLISQSELDAQRQALLNPQVAPEAQPPVQEGVEPKGEETPPPSE